MARQTKTGSETSIQNGRLYFEDCEQAIVGSEDFFAIVDHPTVTTIRVISLSSEWVVNAYITPDVVIKEAVDFEFTLRKEKRRNGNYWYAYRRVLGTLHKRYLGSTDKMTVWELAKLANKLPQR